MLVALTHDVSSELNKCELCCLVRSPIDIVRAGRQHEAYCSLLAACGAKVVQLSVNKELPDSTFIEDTAVVVDEIAVMASMGVESRRKEVRGIEVSLAEYRDIARIHLPANLEGGDVLRVGKTIFAGLSPRTNRAGVESLAQALTPLGYKVVPVDVKGCLHLKSACTALDDCTMLANLEWIDPEPLKGFRIVTVPEEEPWAANVLSINGTICMHTGNEKTIKLIRNEGYRVSKVDISELMKAEAGMTCSSILFEHP